MDNFLIRLLNKFNLLNYFNLLGKIDLNGREFKIPVLGKLGFSSLHMTEPWMIDLLKIVIPIENGKFIDVGVNTGQTLLKLRSVSEEMEYIGFEPNPICISYVTELIKKNSIKYVDLLPVGISNKTELGKLIFYYENETDSSASIIEEFRPNEKVFKKEYIPLFDLRSIQNKIECDNVSILKIDVEGAELEVIKSFLEKIESDRPIILMEILPAYNSKNTERINRQTEILASLKKANYSLFRVIKKKEIFIDIKQLEEIDIHSDMNNCEYVFVPDSKLEKFKLNLNKKRPTK